ncbi:ubiquitin ligase SCF complex subunit Cullin [Mrakia frigida]|uniref:cullin family protein n=1 Tax=Mrakia frigida TaxID=29902 RepID=UPI003FCC132B
MMGGSSSFGKKPKGKIRPPKSKSANDFDQAETWRKLKSSIREIQNHHSNLLSYEENYRYAYNMVLFKRGEFLYDGVGELVSLHLDQQASSIIVPTFPRSATALAGLSAPSLSSAAPLELGVASGSGTGAGGGAAMSSVERGVEGELFLKAIKGVWDDHLSIMSKLRDVLKYMDKTYTPSAKVPLVYDVGLTLFLKRIIRSSLHPIHNQLISTLLSQIKLERDGEVINRSAMRDAIDILLSLREKEGGPSVYDTDFEKVFLSWTGEFYKEEGERLVEDCEAGVYLKKVERRLEEEAARAQHYLSSQTSASLQKHLQDNLITAHLRAILTMPGSGLVSMLDSDRMDDLARLYRVFGKVPLGMKELKKAMKESVKERGEKVNEGFQDGPPPPPGPGPGPGPGSGPSTGGAGAGSSMGGAGAGEEGAGAGGGEKDPKGKGKGKEGGAGGASAAGALQSALRWVQEVLDLKDKFDRILREAFSGDKTVQTAINEAFESFVNANPKSAEYISLFIDDNLKKGLKGKTEEEVDVVLDKTITLFRFLTDKDVFERYYKSHLGKRLIQGRSVSDDAERGMVAKLKIECGYQFTQKLEGMFNDMRVSSDTMTAFKTHLAKTTVPLFELSVNVLTSTFWPGNAIPAGTIIPPLLKQACVDFESFYLSRHSGRRLTWQPNQGTADVKARFKARSHELNVSTYALIVLMLFDELDEAEELSYEDISTSTQIPAADLTRTLQSLACGKYRILTKYPKSREVATSDSFAFNDGFTAPLAKIKIAMVVNRVETGEERSETVERVDEERRHLAEACIVRILKSAKTMSHIELMNEVTRQLAGRFQPTPSMIKKRIEALIDREYLERGSDMKTYTYLA